MADINLSPYTAEHADILRRQKMAELMQQQSMQPLEPPPTSGGWAVQTSPFSVMAKMLQGYAGAKGQTDALSRQQALAARLRTDATQQLGSMPQGAPATPEQYTGEAGTMDELYKPAQAATEPSRQQMQAWALKVAGGGNPIASPIATKLAEAYLKPASQDTVLKEQGLDRRFAGVSGGTAATIAGADRRHATMTPAEQSTHDEKQGWGEPYSLGGATVQRNRITGEVRQAVARPPQTHVYNPPAVTTAIVQDPSNPGQQLTVDARTYKGGSLGAPGVVGVSGKLGDVAKNEQKLSLGKPQAKLRVDTMAQNLDKLDTAIKELDKDPGLTNITGTFYGRTPNVTNAATGAQAQLNSIKSQIFVSALQAMREASKTGGAVGNVSDREGDKLEATLAALDQAQGTPAFRQQLAKARQQIDISKTLLRQAYEEQFGGIPDFQGVERRRSTDSGPPPGAVQRIP